MRILLLGAGGQLAYDLALQLADHELVTRDRQGLDICQAAQVEEVIAEICPQVVINTAAYNLVDQAESEPDAAMATNFRGPRNLARVCGAGAITLVHFSTDYVFGLDSERRTPWSEEDVPGPVSVYGISKLAGEHAVCAYCPQHFVVRTCGLYGIKGSRGKGGNFVETMLRLAAGGGPVRVVDDQTCTPSYTADVARATIDLLATERFGLYHLTNAGSCSWYALAREIYRQAGLQVECAPITSAEFGAAACRPTFSVLSNEKLHATGVTGCRPWQEALADYLAQRTVARARKQGLS